MYKEVDDITKRYDTFLKRFLNDEETKDHQVLQIINAFVDSTKEYMSIIDKLANKLDNFYYLNHTSENKKS